MRYNYLHVIYYIYNSWYRAVPVAVSGSSDGLDNVVVTDRVTRWGCCWGEKVPVPRVVKQLNSKLPEEILVTSRQRRHP